MLFGSAEDRGHDAICRLRVEELEGLVPGIFYNGGWKTNRHHRNGQVAIRVWRRSQSEGRQREGKRCGSSIEAHG